MASSTSTKKTPVEDHLTEDSPINGQNYFVLSYLLPDETKGARIPMIKVRGTYKTVEDCQRRIDSLKSVDKYFNLFIAEVGKWGGLYTNEEVMKMDDVDVTYRNETMNNMMKEYKKNKDQNELDFEERRKKMINGESNNGIIPETLESIKERSQFIQDQINEMSTRLDETLAIKKRTDLDLKKMEEAK